jgi:hypothetical protein
MHVWLSRCWSLLLVFAYEKFERQFIVQRSPPSYAANNLTCVHRYLRKIAIYAACRQCNNHAQQRDHRIAIFKTATTCIEHGVSSLPPIGCPTATATAWTLAPDGVRIYCRRHVQRRHLPMRGPAVVGCSAAHQRVQKTENMVCVGVLATWRGWIQPDLQVFPNVTN